MEVSNWKEPSPGKEKIQIDPLQLLTAIPNVAMQSVGCTLTFEDEVGHPKCRTLSREKEKIDFEPQGHPPSAHS